MKLDRTGFRKKKKYQEKEEFHKIIKSLIVQVLMEIRDLSTPNTMKQYGQTVGSTFIYNCPQRFPCSSLSDRSQGL